MELGEPDRSGRRRPVPVEGSGFVLEADTVIGAIGQGTDTSFLWDDLPVRLTRWGDVEVDGATMQSSERDVFAGGDCVTGPATVVQAVAAGRRVALAIDDLLRLGYVRPSQEEYTCSRGSLEDLPRDEYEDVVRVARVPVPALPVEDRLAGSPEVELTLTAEQARTEAARCLACGCAARDGCALRAEATAHGVVHTAPLHARPRVPVERDHPFLVRDPNKCITCGLCVAACAELEGPGVLGVRLADGRLAAGTPDGRPLSLTDCISCGQCGATLEGGRRLIGGRKAPLEPPAARGSGFTRWA